MTTIFMPAGHQVSSAFSIAGFRDVDVADDKPSYFSFLDSFADAFRTMTERGVDLLHLGPGSSVLDVGCGHGSCAPLLSQRVGLTGRIVGVDASHAMIAEAQRRFGQTSLSVEFHQGDAQALLFEAESFDATRADRVFMFLKEPRQALAELVRVTRPGGRIVVTEGDLGSHIVDASDMATTRAVMTGLNDRSPNGWSGRRLRAMFLQAGLRDVEVDPVSIVTTSFAEWNSRLGVERWLSNPALSKGIDCGKALAWLDELRNRDAQGRFFATALLFIVAATQ